MPIDMAQVPACTTPGCKETSLKKCPHCGNYYCEKHIRAKLAGAPSPDEKIQVVREGHPCPKFTSKFSRITQIPQSDLTAALKLRDSESVAPAEVESQGKPQAVKYRIDDSWLYFKNNILGKIIFMFIVAALVLFFYVNPHYISAALMAIQNLFTNKITLNNITTHSNTTLNITSNSSPNESLRIDALSRDILDGVNSERLKHGLNGLDWNDQLGNLAKLNSNALLYNNPSYSNYTFGNFTHDRLIYLLYLYENCTFNSSGSLQYCSYMKQQEAVSKVVGKWLNDTASNKTLLSSIFTDAGVGVASNETFAYITLVVTDYNTREELKKLLGAPSDRELPYVLRGMPGRVNITVYSGIKTMLAALPRSYTCQETEEVNINGGVSSSSGVKCPSLQDRELNFLNQSEQSKYLKPLVDEIKSRAETTDNQARIAISLVQNIPYDSAAVSSNKLNNRYPYEVVYDNKGVCEEKSRLLAFILRDLGYGVVLFYYKPEDHMAVGVKCPLQYSYENSGYCFIETTSAAIPTDSKGTYAGVGKLTSTPQILNISTGASFDSISEEYNDAQEFSKIRSQSAIISEDTYQRLLNITNKYGIVILH